MLEDKRTLETKDTLSRRDFLVKAGALTAGMAVAGGIMGSSMSSEAAIMTYDKAVGIPFKALDPEKARREGFKGYKDATVAGGCCAGSAYGLLKCIQDQKNTDAATYDARWDKFYAKMWAFGAGGVTGASKGTWGTLCGALNGATYVMSLAVGSTAVKKLGQELWTWYCKYPFPSPVLEAGIGTSGTFFVPEAQRAASSVTSVAGSPLCHVSVSNWATTAGKKIQDPEKAWRCARLTGDVCAKAALLLNAYQASRMRSVAINTEETDICMQCHAPGNVSTGGDYAGKQGSTYTSGYNLDSEQGKMPCVECHTDGEPASHTSFHSGNTNDCGSCHDL